MLRKLSSSEEDILNKVVEVRDAVIARMGVLNTGDLTSDQIEEIASEVNDKVPELASLVKKDLEAFGTVMSMEREGRSN